MTAMAVNTKVRLRPFYGGSTWSTVAAGIRDDLKKRTVTNAEAVALIREWRNVSHTSGGLWAQFAGAAYGYAPPKRSALVNTAKQASATYPLKDALVRWMGGIATELDARGDGQPPRIAPDKDTFADPVFYGAVRAQLAEDGMKQQLDKTPPVRVPATKQGSGGWLILAVLAWMVLTPNRRSRG